MIAQMTATITADQPRPTRLPKAHMRARDRNRSTKWPATPAPPNSPAPLPVTFTESVAFWIAMFASALASAISCWIRVVRLVLRDLNISPSDSCSARSSGSDGGMG